MRWLLLPPRLMTFGLWFVGQMIRANWQVAHDVLTPGSALTPGVIAYRTRCRTRAELTLLSDLITLTPGTLTLDVDLPAGIEADVDEGSGEDIRLGAGTVLYILGLYAPADSRTFHRQLARMEDRLLSLMRGPEFDGKADDTTREGSAR